MRRWRRFVPLNRFKAHSIVRHEAYFFFAEDRLQIPPVMVAFYEFRNRPESNSVVAREHEVERAYAVEAVDLTGVLATNQLQRIDVLFSNCEGGELGLLEEILAKPDLSARLGQMCISFHPQIYRQRTVNRMLDRLASRAEIIKDVDNDWPSHLFINRDLLTPA